MDTAPQSAALDATFARLGLHFVDGAWTAPLDGTDMPVINPADETVLGHIVLGGQADVDRAVAAAVAAFGPWSMTPKAERLALLRNLLALSQARLPDLAKAISLEMGAPIDMALEAQADVAVGHLQGFIDALEAQAAREELPNGDVLTREPIGVCGLITPWNWPLNQITLKVLPALAAGCTCVLKPSEFTPLSSVMYAQLIADAGFPAGVFNMVQGEGAVAGAALSRHKDIAMMSFTGSTRAGTAVSRDAAETVKRVTLELGGKSPNVVFADCEDLPARIAASVDECFYNTGQSCDAPTRLIVEDSIYDTVVDLARAAAEATEVGDPALPGAHIGPLVSDIQFGRVQALIEAGVAEGARVVAGGPGKPAGRDAGYWVRPTVFADVTPDMTIARQEVFGPVLAIMKFTGEAEAVDIANDTPYGLAGYVQTGSRERFERVARGIRAGMIHWNGGGFNYGSPFGGFKQSGNGREGGMLGLEDFQEVKTLHYPG
ncbi:MAG: aldehyde dehydrogenase family protein [Rhodobacteraceae bacterium]|nr:aldehyde dehydrogenase family protein [Paracoccaceae bacterium]